MGFGNDFLALTPNTKTTQTKTIKQDDIKLSSICTGNKTNKMKRGNLLNGEKYLQTTYLRRG